MSVEISIIVQLLNEQGFKQGADFLEEATRRLLERGAIPPSVGTAEVARRLLNERATRRSKIGHYELDDPANFSRRDPAYWNRLYRQNRDGSFTDVTAAAGLSAAGNDYGMGVAVGDYNNDGFADLYVTSYGRNTLYRNRGDGTFTDVTAEAGVGAGG